MAAAAASSARLDGPRTYGNWRRPTTAGLFGLGSLGTGLMLGGLIITVLITMVAGLLNGLIAFALLTVMLGTILMRDQHGKSLLDRMTARIGWFQATRSGANLYRSGPLGMALWGTHQLPGIAAQLRLSEHSDSYGRKFALIHAPATATYTAVIGTEPDGASLVDPGQVDIWVADWGHWLAALADEPGIEAAAVTIETSPDTGHRLRREVTTSMDETAPPFARNVLTEIVDRYPSGSSIIKAYVTLTFSSASPGTGKKRTASEMGRDLAARLPGLTGSLGATGAGSARPLDATEICETVRGAYSPATARLIDEAHAQGEGTDLTWTDVGPAAAEAEWDGYHHDDAYSTTWTMTTAPRGNVQASILARLLAPSRDVEQASHVAVPPNRRRASSGDRRSGSSRRRVRSDGNEQTICSRDPGDPFSCRDGPGRSRRGWSGELRRARHGHGL